MANRSPLPANRSSPLPIHRDEFPPLNPTNPWINSVGDSNDPYYLDPSDGPGQVLVSKLFDGTVFFNWKFSMEISLSAKNKFGFVNGEIACPDRSSPLFRRWERCNNMLIAWLLNSMEKEIAATFMISGDARRIWLDLHSRYSQVNSAQRYTIEKQISNISQAADSIHSYFTRLKRLWDEKDSMKSLPPCTCGRADAYRRYEEDQRLLQFLMGLTDSYCTVRGNLLMQDPPPRIDTAYAVLIQEETQVQSTNRLLVDSSSMNASSNSANSSGSGSSNSINSSGGESSTPPSGGGSGKGRHFCTHCRRPGHTVERCFKLHGFPKPRQGQAHAADSDSPVAPPVPALNSEQYAQLLTLLQKTSVNSPSGSATNMAGEVHEGAYSAW